MKNLAVGFCLVCLFITYSLEAQNNELERYSFAATTQYFDAAGQSIGFIEFSRILRDYPEAQLKIKANSDDILERIDVLSYKAAVEEVATTVVQTAETVKTVSPPEKKEKEKPVHIIYDENRKRDYEVKVGTTGYFTTTKELEGQKAPYFLADILNKANLDNLELKGKVIVLKFWFTTCAPCIQELPDLNRLKNNYRSKNVNFFAPAVDTKTKVEKFMKKHAFNYDIVLNGEDMAVDYKVPGYPTHVVINPTGTVQKVLVGENSMTYSILKKAIDFSLLYQADDILIEELGDFETISFSTGTIIENEEGKRISESDYIKYLKTNRYKIFKRIKDTGELHYILVEK